MSGSNLKPNIFQFPDYSWREKSKTNTTIAINKETSKKKTRVPVFYCNSNGYLGSKPKPSLTMLRWWLLSSPYLLVLASLLRWWHGQKYMVSWIKWERHKKELGQDQSRRLLNLQRFRDMDTPFSLLWPNVKKRVFIAPSHLVCLDTDFIHHGFIYKPAFNFILFNSLFLAKCCY